MLFILDDTLIDNLHNPKFSEDTKETIHRIFSAWVCGDHLVMSSEYLLNFFISENLIYESDKPHAKRLKNKLSYLEYLQRYQTYINVVGGDNIWNIIENTNNLKVCISPDIIVNSHITDQTVIIFENIHESNFYSLLLDAINFDRKNHYKVSFLPANGGGDTTHEVFTEYQKRKDRICFCIVDSDKKYPQDTVGSTANKIRNDYERNLNNDKNAVLSKYYVTDFSEIENIIPLSVLFEIVQPNSDQECFMNWFVKIIKINLQTYFFMDIKKGLSLSHIGKKNDIDNFRFWSQILGITAHDCMFLSGNECTESCANCINFTGMGDHVLEMSIEVINKMSPQKRVEASKEITELYNYWNMLSDILIYWTCSTNPRYI